MGMYRVAWASFWDSHSNKDKTPEPHACQIALPGQSSVSVLAVEPHNTPDEQVIHPFHRRTNRGRGHHSWQAKQHHSWQVSVTSKPGCSPCWWLAPVSRGIGSGFFWGVGGDKTPHPRTALKLREAWGRDKRKLMARDHTPPNPGWKSSEKPKAVD